MWVPLGQFGKSCNFENSNRFCCLCWIFLNILNDVLYTDMKSRCVPKKPLAHLTKNFIKTSHCFDDDGLGWYATGHVSNLIAIRFPNVVKFSKGADTLFSVIYQMMKTVCFSGYQIK